MQPNLQNCVPVTLFAGTVTGSVVTIPLNVAYDHYITRCFAAGGAAGSSGNIYLQDPSGYAIWVAYLDNALTPPVDNVTGGEGAVLQGLSEVTLRTDGLSVWARVDAFRLSPSATAIFG